LPRAVWWSWGGWRQWGRERRRQTWAQISAELCKVHTAIQRLKTFSLVSMERIIWTRKGWSNCQFYLRRGGSKWLAHRYFLLFYSHLWKIQYSNFLLFSHVFDTFNAFLQLLFPPIIILPPSPFGNKIQVSLYFVCFRFYVYYTNNVFLKFFNAVTIIFSAAIWMQDLILLRYMRYELACVANLLISVMKSSL
jgi:hypothetical protein